MTENSYRVCAVFTMKDQHSKDRFIAFCNGENGLSPQLKDFFYI